MALINDDKKKKLVVKNPIEAKKLDQIDPSMLNELKLAQNISPEKSPSAKIDSYRSGTARKEFTIFSLTEHTERRQIPEQINTLIAEIRREVDSIKRRSAEVQAEVNQIDTVTLQSIPEKPGIYHVLYLESVLELLHGVRAKVGEAKTWLSAMVSKKKKRGSFLALSKKKGTQYSLSQELQITRSVG